MSQAAKQVLGILVGVLLCCALAFCGFLAFNNSTLLKEKSNLTKQLDDYRVREANQAVEHKNLQEKFDKVEKEKNDLQAKINNAGGNVEEISAKLKEISRERDELKTRFETLQKERDDLTAKLVEKSKAPAEDAQKTAQNQNAAGDNSQQVPVDQNAKPGSPDDEDYWAKILKAKAALQMDLDKVKEDLSKSALEISELKKQNSDLQLEISKLNTDKESIAREIKYGNDLAKNLSLELARSQGEKQFMADRMNKIAEENTNLHEQLKSLTSTKVALERSIVKLQGDKKQIEGKLFETEGVIQNRVEQIYQLKDSLEKDFKPAVKNPKTGEVDLSPIIVSSDKNSTEIKSQAAEINGSVVSINDENNFVIVNLGEDSGIKVGEKLNVYRGAEFVAGLEVIQVRKDILAADIKNKMMAIQVGDSVK